MESGKLKNAGRENLNLSANALEVLERRYLLRDAKGRLIETPTQLFRRVARTMALVEKKYGATQKRIKEWEDRFYNMMTSLDFMPNTPCLMNAGARLRQLSACFVVDVPDDLKGIAYALEATAQIHQSGGGTGFSFSHLRPKGDRVASTGGKASGPISFMRIFDALTDTMKQGGVRRGANMGVLRVDHPDILEFIRLKGDPKVMNNFNLSVAATDAFMRAAENGKDYALINPRTQKSSGKLNAREVLDLIAAQAWKTGDPGMIFIDEINRKNPTQHIGAIEATNPCGEVPLHPWESCNLGSLNLARFVNGNGRMDWERLAKATKDAVRFLDNMIDASEYPLEEIADMTRKNRRIGLGVMGFAEALILMGIPYDSDPALKAAEEIMSFVERESVAMSQELGKERGSFPNFKGSLWKKKGFKTMRNATTTAIAPTGTISIIADCSSGIEPLFAATFTRNVMEGAKLVERRTVFKGATALNISMEWHVRMQAAFQKFTHSAVSKTINLPLQSTAKEVLQALTLAWKLKCKGLTVYRYGSRLGQVLTLEDEGCTAEVCAGVTT